MKKSTLLLAHFIIFLVFFSACNNDDTITPQHQTGTDTLLKDDFSGIFPGGNWIIDSISTIDSSIGNPPPSLDINLNSWVNSSSPFPDVNGLTVSFDALILNSIQTGFKVNNVFLKDNNNGPFASMIFYKSNLYLDIEFFIGSSLGVLREFAADSLFHRYVFVYKTTGWGEWYRDGSLQYSANLGKLDTYVKLNFQANDSLHNFRFDNVLVTSP